MKAKKSLLIFFSVFILLSILTLSLVAYGNDSNDDSYYYGGMLNTVSNDYFLETGWREISQDEINICMKGLTSDLTSDLAELDYTTNNFAYGTSATLQAIYAENYDEYFYEMAWYVWPTTKNVTISLKVINENTGVEKEIMPSTKVNMNDGKSYYYAFKGNEEFTHAVLNYQDGTIKLGFEKKNVEN